MAIGLLALAIRIAWAAYSEFTPTYSDDAGRYEFLGRALADGRGFTDLVGRATMFWPPGYPFLLAGIYKTYPERIFGPEYQVEAALVVNAVLGAGTVLLVYALGRRAFSSRVALGGALITACFPSLVMFAGVTLSETAFTSVAMLALWVLLISRERDDWRLLALAGLIFGMSALIRGPGLLLPAAVLPYLWMSCRASGAESLRRAVGLSAATLACAMVVVLPWTARNFAQSRSFVLISSNAGPDFYIGHAEDADGGGRRVDELVLGYPDIPLIEAEAKFNREGFERGVEYALGHPWREVQLSGLKMWHLYKSDHAALRWNESHGQNEFLGGDERTWWVRVMNAYYYAVLAFAALGIAVVILGLTLRRLNRRSEGASPRLRIVGWFAGARGTSEQAEVRVLLLCVIVYWTLVHVAFFGDPRFHAPVMPIVALFASFGGALMAGIVMIAGSRIRNRVVRH